MLIWAGLLQVVKVLHGADSDIVWLQRDFGIYVVNLFDTGQAARVLTYPSAGLAYLLSKMCGVKVRQCVCNIYTHSGNLKAITTQPSMINGWPLAADW